MKLRPYQERIVSAVVADIRAKTPEIVLAGAPGSGKTEMAFAVIRRALAAGLASRVLVLAHGTTVLRRQFADRAVAEFGAEMVHEVTSKATAPPGALVLVALPQSLHRRESLPSCALVIVDEAHEFYDAKMAKRVIRSVGAESVALLTGSPSKFIARGLPLHSIALYDVMRECPEAVCDPDIELVASDFLIPYDRYNADGEVQKGFRFGKAQAKSTLDGLLTKMVAHLPRRKGNAAPGWHETIEAMGKTIVACRSVALARQTADYFRRRGVTAGLSTHEDDEGSKEIERFKDDASMPLLIVVRRGVLGFNFTGLINLVDMTGTVNIDRIFQMFARVVRPHPTKPKTKKRFVKIAPKGEMEEYTRDVVGAALQLGRKETFEVYNGGNSAGIVIPKYEGGESTSEERARGNAPAKKKPRGLPKCFSVSDFFEVARGMDSEFSLYAKTTLGQARARVSGQLPRGLYVHCSFDGCGRPHSDRGLCAAHSHQRWRGVPLAPLRERIQDGALKNCAFDGCKNPIHSHRLCSIHAGQARRGQSLKPAFRHWLVCSHHRCEGTHYAKGACKRHYDQRQRSKAACGA